MFSSGSVWSVTCENRVRNPEDVTLHAQNMNIPLNQHFARRRRGNLPKDSVRVLKSWLYSNRIHACNSENCIKITAEMDHDYEKGPNIKNAILMKLDGKDELNEFDILVNTAVMLRDMERKDD
ncbi:hypothetical protein D910_06291 [Dendroctonus ponderosae]|uniref:Homeobox KN domain-containing protein n=1 Tax=Dendroctonus ponderosae TaxID=77166 RepID=U4U9B8_DENPD|nr:hypothetical protein D910_06291 [Dendroctonus ponderosae]